jgi:hypothetical protein
VLVLRQAVFGGSRTDQYETCDFCKHIGFCREGDSLLGELEPESAACGLHPKARKAGCADVYLSGGIKGRSTILPHGSGYGKRAALEMKTITCAVCGQEGSARG